MDAYVKYFEFLNIYKYINFLVNDEKILEKQNRIWDEIKNLFNKKFDSEPVYNDKYIKAKINFMVIKHQQKVNIMHAFL